MKNFLLIILTIFLLATAASAQEKKAVIMTGLEVVPDVRTHATGGGEAWVQSDTLYVRLEFENLMSPYFAANIHYGEEGENGNPLFPLEADLEDDHRSGVILPKENKFPLSDALKEAFENGNLYVTVASSQHQRGEIRGQINGY